MKSAQDRLLEYRSQKKRRSPSPKPESSSAKEATSASAEETIIREPSNQKFNALKLLSIDVLNFWPMRKWRELCAAHPVQCWTATVCFWLTGQILAAHAHFGCVYFIFSVFILIFLNLGSRQEDEPSAYSVFNPRCERLLGQLTAEHFERDMLMVRRDVGGEQQENEGRNIN